VLAYLGGGSDAGARRAADTHTAATWCAYPRAARHGAPDADQLLRVTLHRLHTAPGSRLRAVAIAPLFRAPDIVAPVPFHAWSHAAGQSSPPVRFHAAADAIAGFAIDYRLDVDGSCERGREACAVHRLLARTLLPGRYAIAGPRLATGRAPALHRLQLVAGHGAPMRTRDGAAPDFDYVTFTVVAA
jgi:hypothetical protein